MGYVGGADNQHTHASVFYLYVPEPRVFPCGGMPLREPWWCSPLLLVRRSTCGAGGPWGCRSPLQCMHAHAHGAAGARASHVRSRMRQAFLVEHDAHAVEFVGNRTECALLMMLRGWGVGYEPLRREHRAGVLRVYAFTSERKMASVVARTGLRGGLRLYNKARHRRM